MANKISNYLKGTIVYKRWLYGDQRGQVDTSRKFKIRSIGPKQCTLDEVRENNNEYTFYRNRGHNYYLVSSEEAAHWGSSYISSWDQLFVLPGKEGWDPDCNF